jgi:NAD(P)-dependent dehydrogenase (short-subunit alcohol dehydrogenase family)
MERDFEGKGAVVTGGASGIGAAICRELAARGAGVVVGDLDGDAAEAEAARIRDGGGRAAGFAIDVAEPEANAALVAFAQERFGALRLAVNNAGIGGAAARTADYAPEAWRRVLAVNLDGAFYGMRVQIPAMIEAGGGAIVNMASILSSVGFRTAPAYVAAKHALVGLTKTAALEYAVDGVRINAVGPGFIDTPLLSKNLQPEALTAIAGMHAFGRLGASEEVSALTCFLLSDRASFVTGSYHLVDGGYTAA